MVQPGQHLHAQSLHEPATDSDVVHLDETPGHECGVFGVYAPNQPVAHLTYLGLYALQHRGQESAGMAVSDGETVTVMKDMGLVSNAFDDRMLAALTGHLAIGHTRYSTTGSSQWSNAQPFYRNVGDHSFALAHNGNLVNTADLAAELGMLPGAVTSDSDLVAELIEQELAAGAPPAGDGAANAGSSAADDGTADDDPLVRALAAVAPRLRGAFSFVLCDETHVIGLRDPHGFWPLVLGRLDDGWVLASETPALDVVGAVFIREVEPGEMVVIGPDGPRTVRPFPAEEVDPHLCLFEFVYFHRPDGRLYNRNVHAARVAMGAKLADQAPVVADMVMGVPESGLPAAEGYARQSGIPYGQGLVKNRYIGRTFIAPNQQLRALGVRMKLNPLVDSIRGKRLVVVDDSIVRGTTTRAMVSMLREAGVAEVHLRISSPPYRWPCFYGMDTGHHGDLLAANLSVDEIAGYLNVDSIAYLTLDRLVDAVGAVGAGFCDACLTGEYPVEVPVDLSKRVLEPDAPDPTDQTPNTLHLLFGNEMGTPADDARDARDARIARDAAVPVDDNAEGN
jgi:amidophosphoribosyltransferase